MNRRRFLHGLGGALLALPFLEGLGCKPTSSAPAVSKAATAIANNLSRFAIFVRQGNGVAQQMPDEPERFWPSFKTGPMTKARLAADSGRALSELSEHAASLSFIRGVRYADMVNDCKHSGGGNQVLTGARVSDDLCNSTLALGESIDNRIARQLGIPGDEPLTLYAGRKTGYLDEVLSYRGPRQLRAAERNPLNAYRDLFRLSNLDPATQTQRRSVNDLVRAEMLTLMNRTDLSKADRQRLDLHFTSIRDVENGLSCALPPSDVSDLEAAAAWLDNDDNIETVIKRHFDIMTLAVACGARKAATLQLGCGNDVTRYWIDGVRQTDFHKISHRVDENNGNAAIENADVLHHKIDRKLLGIFKYLLDKLAAYPLPEGSLLDHGLTVYVNDLADKKHGYVGVPYLIAGTAGGHLKTGLYVDANGATNNKVLNTIGAAVGCTNALGNPLDDFGDPDQEKGFIDELVAPR